MLKVRLVEGLSVSDEALALGARPSRLLFFHAKVGRRAGWTSIADPSGSAAYTDNALGQTKQCEPDPVESSERSQTLRPFGVGEEIRGQDKKLRRVANALGQMTQVSRVIGARTYVTSYAYDKDGNITQVTMPSGRVVFGTASTSV